MGGVFVGMDKAIMMKKTVLISVRLSLGVSVLGGCEQQRTEEWYMGHHKELIRMYDDCLNRQTFSSERCIPVQRRMHSEDKSHE